MKPGHADELLASLVVQEIAVVRTQLNQKESSVSDSTEPYRRQRVAEINLEPGSREALEQQHGQVWDTAQLAEEFEPLGFLAPFIVVRRRSDGRKGSLEFQHRPRFYFNFQEDR